MPTVLRHGPYDFVFFSSDQHEPPHVHVKRDRAIAKYWLEPVLLARNKGFKKPELKEVAKLVEQFRDPLVEAWHDYLVLEKEPVAVDVVLSARHLAIELADGRRVLIPLEWYPRLTNASKAERQNWRLLGDGYAIEWPDLDEHIGVEGLLAGNPSGESTASLNRWLASRTKQKKKKAPAMHRKPKKKADTQ